MEGRRLMARIQAEYSSKGAQRFRPPAHSPLPQPDQITAADFVPPPQIVVEHQELGQRHGEVIDDNRLLQLRVAESNERLESLGRRSPETQPAQRQSLIKDRLGTGIVVVDGVCRNLDASR